MPHDRSLSALCLSISLAASALCAQDPVARTIPVQHLLPPRWVDPEYGVLGPTELLPTQSVLSLARGDNGDMTLGMFAAHRARGLSQERLGQLVEALSGGEAPHRYAGGKLIMRGPAASIDIVEAGLSALGRSLYRPLQVELHVLRGAPLPASSVLSAEQCEALLSKHSPHRSFRRPGCTGLPIRIQRGRLQEFIRDYDIEVAQRSVIADPKADLAIDGLELGMLVQPMPDGRLHVYTASRQAEVQRPLPKAVHVDPGAMVQLPQVRFRMQTGMALLAAGGGMVLGGADEEYGYLLLRIQADPVQGPGNARGEAYTALPLGDLLYPASAFFGIGLPLRPGYEARSAGEGKAPKASKVLGAQAWAAGLSTDATPPEVYANHLLLARARPDDVALQQHLLGWAQRRRNWTLETRVGLLPAEDVNGQRVSAEALAARLEDKILLPVQPDQGFQYVRGREQNYIGDLEVEIAHRASAPNPVIKQAFAGLSWSGSLRRAGRAVQLDGRLLLSDAEPRRVDSGLKQGAGLDQVHAAFARAEFDKQTLPLGQWRILLLQPGPEGQYAALVVRVVEN